MLNGTITKGIGGFYYIATSEGVYECRARGKFRKEGIKPTVGDHVQISVLDEKNKKGSLDIIEERKNCLIRPRVANIDQALIVFAAVSPDFNQDILDRFIVLAEQQKLNIVICINKTDIDIDGNYNDICKLYTSLDMSGINPDELELYFREFEPYLNDCKYNGCKHLNEDSRFCGVKAQVGKNINESRYIRYKDIYNEIIEERKR